MDDPILIGLLKDLDEKQAEIEIFEYHNDPILKQYDKLIKQLDVIKDSIKLMAKTLQQNLSSDKFKISYIEKYLLDTERFKTEKPALYEEYKKLSQQVTFKIL